MDRFGPVGLTSGGQDGDPEDPGGRRDQTGLGGLGRARGVRGAMLAASVAGERDPDVLAELAKGALRRTIPALRQALRGRFGEHHALLIGLEHTAYLEAAIARLDEHVDAVFTTHTPARPESLSPSPVADSTPSSPRSGQTCPGPHRRTPGLRGKKKAAIAVAHSILVICRHRLTHDQDYDDLGGDYFTRRNTDRQRDRLIKQLHRLGYRVTIGKAS